MFVSNELNLIMNIFLIIIYISLTRGQEKCPDPNDFLCGTGDCISKEYLCDGSKECLDGSDETHNLCEHRSCSQSIDYIDRDSSDIFAIPTLHSSSNFRCDYGACIPYQFICDGLRHCVADSSDETFELCHKNNCSKREFRCDYGACIPRRNACDNRYNCVDKSDETPEACRWRNRFCSPRDRFKCAYGACIRKSLKCNEVIDCLDKSDENEETCGRRPNVHFNTSIPSLRYLPFPQALPTKKSNFPRPHLNFPSPIPKPNPIFTPTSRPNTGNEKTCQGPRNENKRLEILNCGNNGNCDGTQFPADTVILFFCDGNPSPLRCRDGLWYSARDPNEAPKKAPCQTSPDSEDKDGSTSNVAGLRTKSAVPKDCGKLPMFSPIPWLVGLFRDGHFACTGTIIGPSLILTAAHCVVRNQATRNSKISSKSVKVQFYAAPPIDAQDFASVDAIKIHPDFSGGTTPRADVALLILKTDLESMQALSSACLDSTGKLLGVSAWTFNRTDGQSFYFWNNFRQTLNRECFNQATICSRHLDIGPKQFCGVNRESPLYLHKGSSGGPYFIVNSSEGREKWTVAGIVSNSIHTSDCGIPHTVFTSVSKFHSWILSCGFEGKCRA